MMSEGADYNYQEANQEDHGYYYNNRPSEIPGNSMNGFKMTPSNLVQNYQPKEGNMQYQPKAESLDFQLLANQVPVNNGSRGKKSAKISLSNIKKSSCFFIISKYAF